MLRIPARDLGFLYTVHAMEFYTRVAYIFGVFRFAEKIKFLIKGDVRCIL